MNSNRQPLLAQLDRAVRAVLVLALLLLAVAPAAAGRSGPKPAEIKVKPASATLKVSDTKRFTANVKHSADRSVLWSVDGVPGGNDALGTIDQRGLYRAPAWSGRGLAVTVTAALAADPSVAASARIKILASGDPLDVASVAPAAVETGPVTFTITGGGFSERCRVLLGTLQLETVSVSDTSLVATGVVTDAQAPRSPLLVVDPGPPLRTSKPTTVAVAVRPPPAIGTVAPASVYPGPVVFTVTGSGFDAHSRALLGTLELETTFVSPTTLSAAGVVPATLVPGAPLVVFDSSFPSRRSAPFAVTVSLPPLVLQAATPSRVYPGPATFTITGSGFEPDTVALLGDEPLATTFVSATQLTASGEVPAALVPEAALVLVDSGSPDRRSAPFAIAVERITPLELLGVAPASVPAGNVEFTITGTGFDADTGAMLGPIELQTTFISETLLLAAGTVPGSMAPGADLVLVDPGPPARRSEARPVAYPSSRRWSSPTSRRRPSSPARSASRSPAAASTPPRGPRSARRP